MVCIVCGDSGDLDKDLTFVQEDAFYNHSCCHFMTSPLTRNHSQRNRVIYGRDENTLSLPGGLPCNPASPPLSPRSRRAAFSRQLSTSDMEQLVSLQRIDQLMLPRVFVPYSMAVIHLQQVESEASLIRRLSDKMQLHMRNKKAENLVINLQRANNRWHTLNSTEARAALMSILFYDYFKYINELNRWRIDDFECSLGISHSYIKVCQTLYNAFFGDVTSLVNQCIFAAQGNPALLDRIKSCTSQSSEDSDDANFLGSSDNFESTVLPKALSDQVLSVKYLYAQDCCVDEDCHIDSDDILIMIDRPKKVAVGIYCYFSKYYAD